MNRLPSWAKVLMVLMCATLPAVLEILFYRVGGPFTLLVTGAVCAGVVVWNTLWFRKIWVFLLMQLSLLISAFLGCWISTTLYFHHVSNDGLTPVVGMLLAFFLLGQICVATLVITVLRLCIKRKERTV